MKKTKALRNLIESSELSFLMESHNALCAKIVQEAGFQGIWASGLGMSASMGMRDSNELSWTQILEILEFMNDSVSVPILLDGDTGYGNFNNVRLLVQKLQCRGIAGVCIEDKLFPKTNSFINGEYQSLADIDEFCGKIKAGKDTQKDEDFCIVARVEAFIVGLSLSETLKRAETYRKAGADAILIHSKQHDASEVVAFASEWAGRAPLIIIPTTYYSTPTEVYEANGINLVIWANQLLRGTITTIKGLAKTIYQERSVMNIDDKIVPLTEVFRLQGVNELLEAEERYLKTYQKQKSSAIILAASRGEELHELTLTRPKTMISISGKSILQRLVEDLKSQCVHNITVVGGYRAEAINVPGVSMVNNPDYAGSKDLSSLRCALDKVGKHTVIVYGDLLARRYIIRDLLKTNKALTIVVDSNISAKLQKKTPGDYVRCSCADDRGIFDSEVQLMCVYDKGNVNDFNEVHGQWVGIMLVHDEGKDWLEESIRCLEKRDDFHTLSVTDMLNHIALSGHPVHVIYVSGHWLDVNNLPDIEQAGAFIQDITL
jgi:phosphoenolpyruvate phosphomutase